MKKTFRPTLALALCALLALAPITAAAQDTPGTVKFPTSADTADSLIRATNSARTTLSAPITSSATTIAVVSAASFPASGAAVIDNEIIFYTGKTSTTLTGVVRGADSTAAAAHSSGAAVRGVIAAAHHNTLAATIIALQAKLGLGAFTPGSGTFLKGTGTGSSTWGAISAGDVPALDASKITTGTLPDARIASAAAWNAKQAALGFTPLNPANSLSEVASAAAARTNLGLGTISTQSAASVNVTGGTLANVTCTNCTNLGSGTAGGVANTGDTVIGSDTEANGVGDVLIQTGGITRLKFKADGTVEVTANLLKRIDVKEKGAKGDGRVVNDAVTTNGSATVTSATAAFTSADVGKVVWALNGASFPIPTGTVSAVNSSTSITVSGAATASAGGVTLGLATNDTAAITNAVSECNAALGCVLYFPRGYYVTTASHTLNYSTAVLGDGKGHPNFTAGGGTIITATGATQTVFTHAGLYGRIEGLTLANVSSTTPTAGAGIVIAHGTHFFNQIDLKDVMIVGFYDDVDIQTGSTWTIDNCRFYDPVRYGVRVNNTINVDSGDWNITNSVISAGRYNAAAGLRIEGSGGGKITNMKVNGVILGAKFAIGIEAVPVSGTGIIKIDNVSVENVSTGGMKFAGWDRVDVHSYQFGIYTPGSAAYGLYFDSVTDSGYDNIRLYTTDGAGAPGIILNNCARVKKGSVHATGFSPWVLPTGTYSESGYTHNNGWNSVTFQNGWVNMPGFSTCQYTLQNDVVHVKCAAQTGTVGGVMFTLPLGYRPSAKFFVPTYEGGAAKFVSVDASGEVKHEGASNSSVIFNFSFLPR